METAIEIRQSEIRQDRISELISSFIHNQDIGYNSKKLYKRVIKQFFLWISDNDIDMGTITRETIIDYKEDMLREGLSPLTAGLYLTVVRQFYGYLENNRIYYNPAKSVKLPRRESKFRRSALSSLQASDLLKQYEDRPRDFAIISLLLRSGLRTIEVRRLNFDDYKIKGGKHILSIQGKGHLDKDDFIVLSPKCIDALRKYIDGKRFRTGDPLFYSVSNNQNGERLSTVTISTLAKKGLRSIGLDSREFTAHSLRHTTGCSIIRAGGSVIDVQGILRHKSPVTSEIYLQSIQEEMKLSSSTETLVDSQF